VAQGTNVSDSDIRREIIIYTHTRTHTHSSNSYTGALHALYQPHTPSLKHTIDSFFHTSSIYALFILRHCSFALKQYPAYPTPPRAPVADAVAPDEEVELVGVGEVVATSGVFVHVLV
jgi:hypothetical protein